MRILVIDNDPTSNANARMILQNLGHCDEAADRESALTCFRDAIEAGKPYRLDLVDIQLADSAKDSILTVFRKIEDQFEVSSDRQACIFVTTPLSGRQLETDGLMQGADAFFSKPLDKNRRLRKLKANHLLADQGVEQGFANGMHPVGRTEISHGSHGFTVGHDDQGTGSIFSGQREGRIQPRQVPARNRCGGRLIFLIRGRWLWGTTSQQQSQYSQNGRQSVRFPHDGRSFLFFFHFTTRVP